MAQLIIRLHGQVVSTLDLTEKVEWRAGRSSDSDIVLQKEPGISREHFVIRNEGGGWVVDVVSKYGKLSYSGEDVSQVHLEEGSRFHVTPYEFEFSAPPVQELKEENSGEDFAQATTDSHLPQVRQANTPHHASAEDNDFMGNDEKTSIGVIDHCPYIKILNHENVVTQILKLEGNYWMAGRDSNNAIHIADNRVSRNQFEITKQGENYYIRDLDSVNGTMINGNLITANELTPLISGDTISVLENHLVFELRDSGFSQRVQELPVSHLPSFASSYGYGNLPQNYNPYGAPVHYSEPEESYDEAVENDLVNKIKKLLGPDQKTQIIRGSLIALLIIGGLYGVIDSLSTPQNEAVAQNDNPLAHLSPEQQSLVKHTYELAKNLFMQGKHELAAAEIAKVHELVPEYLDSRQIEELTKTAREIRDHRDLLERQAREARQMEQKINAVITECKKIVNNDITSEEMIRCLAPAMELNPEHSEILALQQQVEERIRQRQEDEMLRRARESEVQKGVRLYQSARNLDNKGDWLEAISAYNRFINASVPDPSGNKSRARSRIKALRKEIDQKIQQVIDRSNELYKARDLKSAALILDDAIKIDPGNKKIKTEKAKIISELEKEMRVLYQESVLEESLGKISAAKDRWSLIMEKDVPEGEYYKRAASKLGRYGDF